MELNENPMMREQFLKDGYVMCYSGMLMKKRPVAEDKPRTILDELPALLHPQKQQDKK